jgi:hypothetical protein
MREKTGGRQKGVLNKNTAELKVFLKEIIEKELDKFDEMMEGLPPKERMEVVIKILPYVLPKQSEVSVTENDPPKKILIKFNRSK